MVRAVAPFLLLASCTAGSGRLAPGSVLVEPVPVGRVRIAVVGTMNGHGSWRGRPAVRGVRAAIAGREDVELRVYDDRGSHLRSTELVRRAARAGGLDAVVFAGIPRALPRAERALARAGVPGFLIYGDLASAGRLTRHTFQMGPSFRWAARDLVKWALGEGHADGLGALTEASVLGSVARKALQEELRKEGEALVRSEVFSPSRQHLFPSHLRRLRDAGVSALFIEGSPPEFGRINGALEEIGWRPRLLGFDLTLSPAIEGPAPRRGSVAAGESFRGAHLPGSDLDRFRRAAIEATGQPPLWWEHRSYAAARLVLRLVREARPGADLASALAGARGGARFGPRDHVWPNENEAGLWKVVAAGERSAPRELPWTPLTAYFGSGADGLPGSR